MILAAASISPLWYLSRAAGYVGLILLGLIGVLGIITAGNIQVAKGTKFLAPDLHRSLSLLAIVVLTIHVGAAVADKYSFIGLKDVFIPFISAYRPIWVGIGAIAVDLGIAVVVTSLLRVKMGYRSWKIIHWISYPVFALSVIHGLGSGTDSALWFSKFIYVAVGGLLVLAIIARLLARNDLQIGKKAAYFGVSFAVPLLIIAWAASGPLAANWAKRAQGGFRQAVLTSARVTGTVTSGTSRTTATNAPSFQISPTYTSGWSGSIDQSPANAQGEIALRLMGRLSASPGYVLSVVLIGIPLDGGVSMTSSVVEVALTVGTVVYKGTVTALNGTTIVSQVTDSTGQSVSFSASLNLGSNGSSFTGTVAASGTSSYSDQSSTSPRNRSEASDR